MATPRNNERRQQANPKLRPPHFSPHLLLFQHEDTAFRPKVPNRGGGRGFLAVKDIQPGTLLLAEMPCADIPHKPEHRDPAERCLLHLASGRVPLQQAQDTLANLMHLHPQRRADIEDDRYAALKSDAQSLKAELALSPLGAKLNLYRTAPLPFNALLEISQAASLAGGEDGLPAAHPDEVGDPDFFLIRALCALHFNGFVTGVYVNLAMINHSCVPNCVKWGARDGAPYSEVRAARFIRAGEELTISYLVPSIRSKSARQRALQGQFQFQCKCDLCEGRCNPVFEKGPTAVAETLENELELVERHDLEAAPRQALDRALQARDAALRGGLHQRHLAVARAHIIISEAALSLLDEKSSTARRHVDPQLILYVLESSASLRPTQVLLFREGVPYADDRRHVAERETRSEAETTLVHLASSVGFFVAQGARGEDLLKSVRADGSGELLFEDAKDAVQCQLTCEGVARCVADLYEPVDLPIPPS